MFLDRKRGGEGSNARGVGAGSLPPARGYISLYLRAENSGNTFLCTDPEASTESLQAHEEARRRVLSSIQWNYSPGIRNALE